MVTTVSDVLSFIHSILPGDLLLQATGAQRLPNNGLLGVWTEVNNAKDYLNISQTLADVDWCRLMFSYVAYACHAQVHTNTLRPEFTASRFIRCELLPNPLGQFGEGSWATKSMAFSLLSKVSLWMIWAFNICDSLSLSLFARLDFLYSRYCELLHYTCRAALNHMKLWQILFWIEGSSKHDKPEKD